MRRTKKLLGNQGSTLLIVLIAVSFITILGTMTLSISAINLQMKSIENKSKRYFYSAEAAVDELKAGLESEIASIVEEVYTNTMITYSELPVGERNRIFKQNFLKAYLDEYATSTSLPGIISIASGSATYDESHLKNLLDKTKTYTTIAAGKAGGLKWVLDTKDTKEQYIKFEKVTLEYISEDQFVNTIQTDIKVAVPNLNMESIGILPSFTGYAIVADDQLKSVKGSASLYGDVFAGTNGILAEGDSSSLSISGEKIVTKDTILAKDGATIVMEDQDEDDNKYSLDIWAKNIETNAMLENTSYTSEIKASGNLYIADDTTLNAQGSKVTYQGSYYGYGWKETPGESSAMIINRQNCKLDLSGLSNLFVAGRAYIEPAGANSASTDHYIRTGESISIKGSQIAYRLPVECTNASTNPMPVEEYNSLLDSSTGKIDVKLGYNLPFLSKTLGYYVDSSEPYRAIFDSTGTSTYVYLYLNFEDAGLANEYMQAYYKSTDATCQSAFKERLKQYASDILLPNNMGTREGRKTFSGNLMGYQKDGEYYKLYENSVKAELPQQFVTESTELAQMYQAYCKKLKPSITQDEENYTTMFDALIIKESPDAEHPGFLEQVGTATEKLIADTEYGNSYLVNNAGKTAFTVTAEIASNTHLIVATGDVTVSHDFTGLIISEGKISMEDGVSITADSGAIYDLISHTEVKNIFRDYNSFGNYLTTVDGGQLEFASLITLENWKKE